MPSGPGHTRSWRVRPNLAVCPASGPPPRLNVVGPGDPRTPSQQETEEFILTRQKKTSKAIKSGILGLLAPGGGPHGKLPITHREKRGAGLEGRTRTQPRAPDSTWQALPRCPPRRRARVCMCEHACACVRTCLCPLGCSQRFRSSLRVPLSPLKPRLTGGWPHPGSTGLGHRTRLTALSQGHSQSPADRPHPNPATAGQGIACPRQSPRAVTCETRRQNHVLGHASPGAALLFL